uniref:Uncharacterized protein n=1 Tax=Arundo donax TaxID=35708 RepID=A0A0A9HNP2_ARUDO
MHLYNPLEVVLGLAEYLMYSFYYICWIQT